MLTPLIHMHSITYSKVCGRVIGCNYNLLFGPITIIMVLYLHMWVEWVSTCISSRVHNISNCWLSQIDYFQLLALEVEERVRPGIGCGITGCLPANHGMRKFTHLHAEIIWLLHMCTVCVHGLLSFQDQTSARCGLIKNRVWTLSENRPVEIQQSVIIVCSSVGLGKLAW